MPSPTLRNRLSRLIENRWFSLFVTIVAIALTAIPVVQSFRPEKALVCYVISNDPLLTTTAQEIGTTSLLVNGSPVQRPGRLVFDIVASGRTPTRAEDVESPLTVHLRDAVVVQAKIETRLPPDLRCDVRADGQDIVLDLGLLNPGDRIRVAVLYNGRVASPTITGRIAGVSSIRIVETSEQSSRASDPLVRALPPIWNYIITVIAACWLMIQVLLCAVLVRETLRGGQPGLEPIDIDTIAPDAGVFIYMAMASVRPRVAALFYALASDMPQPRRLSLVDIQSRLDRLVDSTPSDLGPRQETLETFWRLLDTRYAESLRAQLLRHPEVVHDNDALQRVARYAMDGEHPGFANAIVRREALRDDLLNRGKRPAVAERTKVISSTLLMGALWMLLVFCTLVCVTRAWQFIRIAS